MTIFYAWKLYKTAKQCDGALRAAQARSAQIASAPASRGAGSALPPPASESTCSPVRYVLPLHSRSHSGGHALDGTVSRLSASSPAPLPSAPSVTEKLGRFFRVVGFMGPALCVIRASEFLSGILQEIQTPDSCYVMVPSEAACTAELYLVLIYFLVCLLSSGSTCFSWFPLKFSCSCTKHDVVCMSSSADSDS